MKSCRMYSCTEWVIKKRIKKFTFDYFPIKSVSIWSKYVPILSIYFAISWVSRYFLCCRSMDNGGRWTLETQFCQAVRNRVVFQVWRCLNYERNDGQWLQGLASEYGGWRRVSNFNSCIFDTVICAACGRALSCRRIRVIRLTNLGYLIPKTFLIISSSWSSVSSQCLVSDSDLVVHPSSATATNAYDYPTWSIFHHT